MRPNRFLLLAPLTLALIIGGSMARPAGSAGVDLPARLTDQQFWRLTEELSEPDGTFQSDNLLSNELVFARIVPNLVARTKPGGAYLGVGPEQNFTYIAAMKPRMAFITDIRRGNLQLQLMYKALFELSADRAEFVSRLFTKPRPADLTTATTVSDLMNAYWEVTTADEAAYAANLRAIQQHLTKSHAFPLSTEDLDGIAGVYRAFYWYGPRMNYSASTTLNMAGDGRGSTYWDLMTQADGNGQGLSYLGSEEAFAFMKQLESRNLVVPVVGNFSGPKALRAIGAYLRQHDAIVTAFYLSNVESYLSRAGTWLNFCANVATMPLDDGSVFIRPSRTVTRQPASRPPLQFMTFVPVKTTGSAAQSSAGRGGSGSIRFVTRIQSGAMGAGLVPIVPEVKSCGGS